ncbi:MAG: hypothetical protein J6R11_02210 [Bacteroidaceae bacterium]|nr:hypothetical protein [Bacteroidaceae bacterium]
MRRLKKNYYLTLFCCTVGILGVVRLLNSEPALDEQPLPQTTHVEGSNNISTIHSTDSSSLKAHVDNSVSNPNNPVSPQKESKRNNLPHPIYSVPSFSGTFPDLQDTHAESARRWGVKPVRNRIEAEKRKSELVFIGSNPFYKIDPGMSSSIPYLVPRAAAVLETIARNYLDSLHIKGIPMHKILVSSALRTEEDVERLRRINVNASPESCHRYGTTFDIPYNRYHTVSPPDENRRAVQNDTLKWILAEVLRDARENGMCHIKYEVKQGCFHITTR